MKRAIPTTKGSRLCAKCCRTGGNWSTVYTDKLLSYVGHEDKYLHETVCHAKEYLCGSVHTNGMANFWSLLKRTLNGTYISVMTLHLFRYVDEQVFRFNGRKLSHAARFNAVMARVLGRRLQYQELVG